MKYRVIGVKIVSLVALVVCAGCTQSYSPRSSTSPAGTPNSSPTSGPRSSTSPAGTPNSSATPGQVAKTTPGLTIYSPGPSHPAPWGTPAPPSSLGGPVGQPGGSGAANSLGANPHCASDQPRAVADLSWTVAVSLGDDQRVAVTMFSDGFQTGNYQVSPSLGPGTNGYTWRGVNPGGVEIWRVLTRHGGTWTPSQDSRFTGPTCPFDQANGFNSPPH